MSVSAMAPRPLGEAARLAALRRYRLLDTPAEADFDFLTKMAAAICGTPCAFVSLVDDQRVWYKSAYGCTVRQRVRDDDYCSWAIVERHGLYITDLREDARTARLGLTTMAPHYRMYCGINLVTSDGHCIGTLCVLDVAARPLSGEIRALLAQQAERVMRLIERRIDPRAAGQPH